jgi:dolichol-phosphate mannosyltransferase
MDKPKISIVVPCYNEEAGIENLRNNLDPVVQELCEEYDVELVFVDDGSTDKTHELLQYHYANKSHAKIVKHDRNRNLGAALKTGFSHATGDFVAALDSDCTYSPKLFKEMLSLMDKDTDIVTVSPYHPKGKVNNVPAYRIFLSKSVSKIYKMLLGSKLYTYTAMVRVYRKQVVDNVTFKSNTFLGVTEHMTNALLQGYKAKELPAELNVRQFGQSKMRTMSVIKDHLGLITRIFSHKVFGKKL